MVRGVGVPAALIDGAFPFCEMLRVWEWWVFAFLGARLHFWVSVLEKLSGNELK
jgi:hypothetical protein